MRRTTLAPLVLITALSLTAGCGAQVDDSVRQRAAAAQLRGGGGGGGAGGGDGLTTDGTVDGTGEDGTGEVTAPDGSVGGTDTTGGGDAPGDTAPGGGPATGGDPAKGGDSAKGGGGDAKAPAGGNGGATDTGVTATSLRIGTVADLSGPVNGLFKGAVIGVQAYVAKVNSEGGVFGRKLVVDPRDSGLDCGRFKSETTKALKDDFALVGSFSLYDDCGADVVGKNGSVPDVHNALGQKSAKLGNNFSIQPIPQGWRTGPLAYYKKTYGAKFSKIGSIYAAVGGADKTWFGTKGAINSLGGKVIYDRGFQPTDTDFTADIVQMKQKGVQMLYITASDAPTFARIIDAARKQKVDWPIIAGGIAYDGGFLKQAGSDANGVINDQQFALFFNADEAGRIPAVKEFQTWTSRVAPGDKKDLFAVFGWSSAQLFVQALKAAGPKAKRADVLAQLKKINKFDASGLIAPANPAGKKPPTCWVLTEIKGGKFVRIQSPANTYRCDGGYFYGKG